MPMLTTVGRNALQPGAFVSFTYRVPQEVKKQPYRPQPPKKDPRTGALVQQPAVRPPAVAEPPEDPNKEIMVLNPNWQGKCHGIDLKRITPAQVEVLRLIMDPATRADPAKASKYPLVQDILRRMDPVEVIKNPISFYAMMVKPFLNRADAYRQYWPDRMYNLKTLDDSKVQGAVTNPKPLFHK